MLLIVNFYSKRVASLSVMTASRVITSKNKYFPDICEDPELRERIMELKTEQESKRLQEAQKRKIRRSQSINTRTQSVRRTSIRDKVLTTKKDAQEEARLRLQAQQVDYEAKSTFIIDSNRFSNVFRHHRRISHLRKTAPTPWKVRRRIRSRPA